MIYQNLGQWFQERGKVLSEKKLRYIGWDHNTRFFSPESFDEDKGVLKGVLDCGEAISFPMESSFWVEYKEGMESEARPI